MLILKRNVVINMDNVFRAEVKHRGIAFFYSTKEESDHVEFSNNDDAMDALCHIIDEYESGSKVIRF